MKWVKELDWLAEYSLPRLILAHGWPPYRIDVVRYSNP